MFNTAEQTNITNTTNVAVIDGCFDNASVNQKPEAGKPFCEFSIYYQKHKCKHV